MDCGCLKYGVGSSFGNTHLIAIITIVVVVFVVAVAAAAEI
jgi:hypothetical protein